MNAIDINNISEELSDSVNEMMDDLGEDADFDALPDELKAQFASVLDSDDIDYEMEEPLDLEALGLDLDKIDEINNESADSTSPSEQEPLNGKETGGVTIPPETIEESEKPIEEPEIIEANTPEPDEAAIAKSDEPEPVVEQATEEVSEEPEITATTAEDDSSANGVSLEVAEATTGKKLSAKEEKIYRVLGGKVEQWRKAGYDIDGLDQYYTDIEMFKVKAKEALKKGKVIRQRYEKQVEMWREKGFDVSELEPLLDKDLDAFQEKAKEVLKKQKK